MEVQTLNLTEIHNEDPEPDEEIKMSFWSRQFQIESTESQRVFDWMFGILLPVACFMFDPIVFKGFRMALLGQAKPFAYTLSFISIMLLIAFKFWGKNIGWLNGFLCGMFSVAGFISVLIGIVLLPFSIIGTLMIVGLLGFTPLLTGIVYIRNAVRAYKLSAPLMKKSLLVSSVALSAAYALTLPYLLNVKIAAQIELMRNGNATEVRSAANKLKYVAPLANFDKLAGLDCDGDDAEKNKALFESYQELTGESLEGKDYIVCNDF